MQNVAIQAIANQAFNIVLDDNQWEISIKTVNENVSVSLILNGVPLIQNLRAVSYQRIIPAEYQESGNFAFITNNQEVVDYTKFGVSQALIYIGQDELKLVRSENQVYYTATDFNPLGALPLRFAPQGYTLP